MPDATTQERRIRIHGMVMIGLLFIQYILSMTSNPFRHIPRQGIRRRTLGICLVAMVGGQSHRPGTALVCRRHRSQPSGIQVSQPPLDHCFRHRQRVHPGGDHWRRAIHTLSGRRVFPGHGDCLPRRHLLMRLRPLSWPERGQWVVRLAVGRMEPRTPLRRSVSPALGYKAPLCPVQDRPIWNRWELLERS